MGAADRLIRSLYEHSTALRRQGRIARGVVERDALPLLLFREGTHLPQFYQNNTQQLLLISLMYNMYFFNVK